MKVARPVTTLICFLAIIFGASACGNDDATAGAGSGSVEVAVIPSVSGMPLFVAQEQGFFKGEGLDVTLTAIEGGGPASLQAMLGDSVEVAHAGVVPTMNAVKEGAAISAIASTATTGEEDASVQLFGREGSGIETVEDLKGRTVGINAHGNFEAFVLDTYILPAHDMDSSSIEYLEIPYTQMESTLVDGQVDAVISYEPFTSRLAANPKLTTAISAGDYLPDVEFPTSVQVAKSDWAQGDDAASYTRALNRGLEWAADHQEETVALMSEETGLSKKVVAAALDNMDFPKSATIDPEAWENLANTMVEAGLLPSETDISDNLVVIGD